MGIHHGGTVWKTLLGWVRGSGVPSSKESVGESQLVGWGEGAKRDPSKRGEQKGSLWKALIHNWSLHSRNTTGGVQEEPQHSTRMWNCDWRGKV